MAAIVECAKIIKEKGNANGQPDMEQLRQLAEAVRKDPALATDSTLYPKTNATTVARQGETPAREPLRDSNHTSTRSM